MPVLCQRRTSLGGTVTDEVDQESSWERFSPGDVADEMFVFVATRRSNSLTWSIPEGDAALLSGAGAYGNDTPKSDDQFEQLLLMGMDL